MVNANDVIQNLAGSIRIPYEALKLNYLQSPQSCWHTWHEYHPSLSSPIFYFIFILGFFLYIICRPLAISLSLWHCESLLPSTTYSFTWYIYVVFFIFYFSFFINALCIWYIRKVTSGDEMPLRMSVESPTTWRFRGSTRFLQCKREYSDLNRCITINNLRCVLKIFFVGKM